MTAGRWGGIIPLPRATLWEMHTAGKTWVWAFLKGASLKLMLGTDGPMLSNGRDRSGSGLGAGTQVQWLIWFFERTLPFKGSASLPSCTPTGEE